MAVPRERRIGGDQLNRALGGLGSQQLSPEVESELLEERIIEVAGHKLESGTEPTRQVLASLDRIRVAGVADTAIVVDFLGGSPDGCRQFGVFISDAVDKPGHRTRNVLVNPVPSFEEAETLEQLRLKLRLVQLLNVEKR